MLTLAAAVPALGGCALLSGMTTSAPPAGSESESGSAPSGMAAAPEDSSAPADTTPPAEAAPAPPKPVSVTLRNTCGETVKVFYGDKPKFGSGTYSSMSSNSSTSHSFMPGDMFWIVDDGQNGVSNVTIAEGTRTVEIQDGCTSMTSR